MKLDKMTISEAIYRINDNDKIMLPSIQRKYVWKEEDIIKFIDSILLEYPIGIFLFWKINPEKIKDKYQFYKFMSEISEKTDSVNPKIEHLKKGIEYYYSVLDGQQRLTSLLVAMDGHICAKKKHYADKDENYEDRYLYIDLLSNPETKEEDLEIYYDMVFMIEETLQETNDGHCWFKLGMIQGLKDTDAIEDFIDEKINMDKYSKGEQKLIRKNLIKVFNKFCREELINYNVIEEDDLDKVTDIFIRVNNGGKKLEKTDLLFSTIVSSWEKARDEVDSLLEVINRKGQGGLFDFNNDFVMRTSMYLIDAPIEMKISNFKEENIKAIEKNWTKIREAFIETVKLLEDLGYNRDNITASNTVMPIVYYIYKGGKYAKDESIKLEFAKYMAVAQLNKLFGASSNGTLNSVRNELRVELNDGTYQLKNKKFNLEQLNNARAAGNRTFKIDESVIDDWVITTEKGPYAFMLLSLIYPGFNPIGTKYHQDHMHPESELKKIDKFKENRNKIGNIQLLVPVDNQEKSAILLKDWLAIDGNKKRAQLLPQKVSYELDKFDVFLKKRNELLKQELMKKFEIVSKTANKN